MRRPHIASHSGHVRNAVWRAATALPMGAIIAAEYHRRVSDTTLRPVRPSIDWHPEPDLISIRDAARSRDALREAGADIWETALDYLYDHAFERAMGTPVDYDGLRNTFFGERGGPAPAPAAPST